MLVILTGIPVTAPDKAMLFKQFVAQIVFVNFIREILGAVSVDLTAFGGDVGFTASIFIKDNIGIIKGIDVNGTSDGMLGETAGTVYGSVIKAGGIVIQHGGCVITAIFVNQSDLFNLIFILVQLIEDFYQILGNFLIANQFPGLNLTVKII